MNLPLLLAFVLALIGGAFAALQTPTNALLGRAVVSPINAALVSFAVGTLALAIVAAIMGVRPQWGAVRELPFYAWFGGLYGAFFVTAAVIAAPRIGLGAFIATLVFGQMMMAVLLDHFGALGLDRQPISPGRIAGVALILGGVLLIRR